mmetsp:Transcript_9150/g.27535  ORF Transcript_9150/g.27535 Transcript_9150/m.27535 type:complete len:305 (-) Transcript_9150:2396-3310(-)
MRLHVKSFVAMAAVALPVAVASAGAGWVLALAGSLAVAVAWQISTMLEMQRRGEEMVLETIPPSHYVEKVRWAMDRLGVEYKEEPNIGLLGVFFLGRPVPALHIRKGPFTSTIYNSSDILRYLWGEFDGTENQKRAEFLRPTPERLSWERDLDKMGFHLQIIVYYMITDRDEILRLWGAGIKEVPMWQKVAARLLYPFLKGISTKVFPASKASSSIDFVESIFGRAEKLFASGRQYLVGDELSYVDIQLAGYIGCFWTMPSNFANHDWNLRVKSKTFLQYTRSWDDKFPETRKFGERMYANTRS